MVNTAKRSSNGTNGPLASYVTPAFLQSLYGIPTTKATQSSNQLLVTGYDNNYANSNDLALFLRTYATNVASGTTFAMSTIDNGQNPQNGSLASPEAVGIITRRARLRGSSQTVGRIWTPSILLVSQTASLSLSSRWATTIRTAILRASWIQSIGRRT